MLLYRNVLIIIARYNRDNTFRRFLYRGKLLFLYDSYIGYLEEEWDDLLYFNVIYSKFKKGLMGVKWI